MPLQVAPDIFKWLQGLALVKEAKRNQNALMQINQQEANKLIDGYAFAVIFRALFKSRLQQQKFKKLQSLKEHSTPAIRLYNWGILAELLKQVGYTLDLADKSKITNYQPEPLAKVLTFLYDLKVKDSPSKQEQQNALKVDIQQIGKKALLDSTNALQFLTISIAKNFKISPQQTLNLFLDNNKYLSHLLAKGVKNSFDPVYSLLEQIRVNVPFIVDHLFCLDQEQNVNFIFNALRSCLIGKDLLVAEKMCHFLVEIYDQYKTELINLNIMRKWIQIEGINTLFFCIKKHATLSSLVFQICYNYLDDEFFKYIKLSQKSVLWNSQLERLIFYKCFVDEANEEIIKKFSITGQFEAWNRFFLKSLKKTKDKQQILLLMAILEQEWNKLGEKFQQSDLGLPNQYINFMRNVIGMSNQLLFLQSSRTLFSLMKSLGVVKNPFAPLIYKILVNSYGSFTDLSKIVYMSDNFIVSFRTISSLPGGPLVQPLLKQLQNSRQWSVIELATVLIEESRIEEEASIDIIQMLTKIAFSDIRFGSIVLDSIFSSLQFMNEQIVGGFLETNVNNCLAQLYSQSKSISKSIKILRQQLVNMRKDQGNDKANASFVAAVSKHIICKNMIGFISKSIYIDQNLKDLMESSIFHTYIKIKIQLKKQQQADLLKPILLSYCPQEEQLPQKIQFYMNQAYPPKPPPEPRRGHSHNHLSKSVTLRPATTEQEKVPVILDPSQLKPSEFAIKDLQKVKKKRYELKTIQVQREKQKIAKQQRIEKFKTIQNERRLVQSMSSIKNDVLYNHIQTTQTKPKIQPQTHQIKQIGSINVRLLNLEKDQQQPYKEDAESVLKRFKKVWRYLFFKYSTRKAENGGEEKVHQGEAWKMLKDYDFNFLKKDQCFTFVRLINEQMKRKNDIQFLSYEGFQDYILQVVVAGYSKIGYEHLPPSKVLLLFIDQLKKITKEKSGSIEIFENPQEAYFQETQVIHQFNKRLKQNPDYILPEGYKRIKHTNIQFEYDVHPMSQKNITSSYIDVLEILDSIISKNNKLGFHLIEPLSIKSETFLAKPFLFQNINQKMKQYSKGYLQPKRSISALDDNKNTISLPSPGKKQFKPYVNFSLGIKLGLAETSIKSKSIAQEVAYCMQDILNAIQCQSPVVRKGRKKITNQFMKRRRAQLSRVSAEKKKQQINWKKRADSVKLQVQALREKRKQADKLKKRKQFLDRKTKKQKEEKLYERKMNEFQKAKAQIAKKKEALLEMKAIQEEKIKKEKEQYRNGVEQYFRKKKQQIRQRQQQYKKKKQQQKYKKQEAEQVKKQFVKRLYLSNLKRQQEVLERVEQIKENYDDVWKATQIQEILIQNKKPLRLLFDLLLKYQKSKISATNYDEIGMSTLNFFALKFQIVPFMLQKTDVNKIFMFAIKNEEDKKNSKKGINFQKFLEVIFLIATKAKKMLNKIIQKRRKKQEKIQAFLNAQKSAGGNHFEAQDVSDSQSSQQSSEEQKPTLQDEYLFNAQNVEPQTLEEVISFLKLPKEKAQMDERYKQALETKISKPRSLLVKELKQTMDI